MLYASENLCIHWRKSKKESTSIPTHDFFSIESEALILGQPFSSKKEADLRQHSNQQNKSSKIHLSQLSGTKGSTNPFHHQIKDTKGKGKTRTKTKKTKRKERNFNSSQKASSNGHILWYLLLYEQRETEKEEEEGKSGGRPHHYMCNICNTENEYCWDKFLDWSFNYSLNQLFGTCMYASCWQWKSSIR